ncbi:site-determining protein [Clostridia bacterium]|nr:site-determining protein [Clostridia bacterium]
MGKVVLINSFKGGVGKSTITVNLALSLARSVRKVLVVDLDSSSGSAAILLGADSAIYTFRDVLTGRKPLESAVSRVSATLPLDMLIAPAEADDTSIGEASLDAFFEKAQLFYDFVIFDCPPGKFPMFGQLVKRSGIIIAVTQHTESSVRATERMAAALSETGCESAKVKLIINRFEAKDVKTAVRPGIVEIIERTKIALLGVIEHNSAIERSAESGKFLHTLKDKEAKYAVAAFDGIAKRLIDESNDKSLDKKYGGIKTAELFYRNDKYNHTGK